MEAMFFDWHYSHYEEPGLMTVKSRFPFSFSVGFRDETNIQVPKGIEVAAFLGILKVLMD